MSSMSSPGSCFRRFVWPYVLCFIFVLRMDHASYAFSIDWDDFHRSKAADLVGYLHYLSTHEPTDAPENFTYQRRLEYKKSAIGYILATGGPNGFSDKEADAREQSILLRSLSFAAFLHETLGGTGDFDLLDIRRSNGFRTETGRIISHLLIAQTALTATRVLIKAGQRLPESILIQTLYNLYESDCLPTLKLAKKENAAKQVKVFAKTFTKELAHRLKVVFEDIMDPISTTPSSTIPLICYSEACLQPYITKICLKDSPASSIQHKPLNVTLKNGLIFSRKADGSMTIKSSRKVNLGRLSLSPSSFYQASSILHSGPLLISKYQDEEELLRSLEAVSAILTGDTRTQKGSQVSTTSTEQGAYGYEQF